MNEEKQRAPVSGGASPTSPTAWTIIDWSQVGRNVRRFQLRIAKAVSRRYIKIRGRANPYDAAFDRYFGRRLKYRHKRTCEERNWFGSMTPTRHSRVSRSRSLSNA